MRFKVKKNTTDQVITLVLDPTVGIVSRPQWDGAPLASLLKELGIEDATGKDASQSDPSRLVEAAGRLCYLSFAKPRPGGIVAYIDNILSSAHGSVLEHANFSYLISGVSRSLTHELVRHRAGWAYSQVSQRYVDDEHLAFVVPYRIRYAVLEALLKDEFVPVDVPVETLGKMTPRSEPANSTLEMGHAWLKGRFADLTEYQRTVKYTTPANPEMEKTERRKIGRQSARNCLPNSTETMLIGTANVRAIRHLLTMRGSRHADEEIRNLAVHIWSATRAAAPELFPDVTPNISLQPVELTLKYPKV